jgi:cell division protein FtsB
MSPHKKGQGTWNGGKGGHMIKYLSGTCGFFIMVAASLFIALFACFGNRGLKEVFALQKELDHIVSVNRDLQQENESLANYIRLLNNDVALIEKIAREELGLVSAGEMIYFFDDK